METWANFRCLTGRSGIIGVESHLVEVVARSRVPFRFCTRREEDVFFGMDLPVTTVWKDFEDDIEDSDEGDMY